LAGDLLHDWDGALADERHWYELGAHAVARGASGGVGRTHAIRMMAFDWMALALLVLFGASWMFLEYVTFRGIETTFRRLREWWRR